MIKRRNPESRSTEPEMDSEFVPAYELMERALNVIESQGELEAGTKQGFLSLMRELLLEPTSSLHVHVDLTRDKTSSLKAYDISPDGIIRSQQGEWFLRHLTFKWIDRRVVLAGVPAVPPRQFPVGLEKAVGQLAFDFRFLDDRSTARLVNYIIQLRDVQAKLSEMDQSSVSQLLEHFGPHLDSLLLNTPYSHAAITFQHTYRTGTVSAGGIQVEHPAVKTLGDLTFRQRGQVRAVEYFSPEDPSDFERDANPMIITGYGYGGPPTSRMLFQLEPGRERIALQKLLGIIYNRQLK